MRPYCEIVVQSLLPSLRALIAKELMEKHKLTQEAAARKLGISQAAVSQYTRALRGFRTKPIEKDKAIKKEIENFANLLMTNPDFLTNLKSFCKICKQIRKRKLMCELHKETSSEFQRCSICFD